MPTTIKVRAALSPHDHTSTEGGSIDVCVAFTPTPAVLRNWPKNRFRVCFVPPGSLGLSFGAKTNNRDWHNCHGPTIRIKKDHGTLDFCIKARYAKSLSLPLGPWEGECQFTDKWCRFSLTPLPKVLNDIQPKS